MIDNNMINGINLVIDIPYPKIKDYKITDETLTKLRSVFSGITSELSQILHYSYVRSIYSENKEISKLFTSLSITEMRHYALLSDFIYKSKNKPCIGFKNELGNFEAWNSSFINYEQGLINIINDSIQKEIETIKKYKNIISTSNNNELNALLSRIILDEERHIELLSSVKKNLI